MTPTDWDSVFEQAERNPPLAADLLRYVSASVTSPLDPEERAALATADAPDPDGWAFPTHPLPASYLAFLGWSNGGFFLTGDRELQILAAEELRPYLLDYRLPYFMPGAVPFALNGGGCFYLFDLRGPPDAAGEYPILFVGAGNLGYRDALLVGRSFPEVCRGRTNPEDDYFDRLKPNGS